MDNTLSIHSRRLYELLKMAFYKDVSPALELFEGINEIEWQELQLLATRHGVKHIAYEGMNALPDQYRPAAKFHQLWFLSVVQAESRRKRYIKAAETLISTLYKGDVKKIVILKGLTVTQYYHTPARRDCGDLDIFLFDDKERCDSLMQELGIAIDTHHQKDSAFCFEGVAVENHKALFDIEMAFKREAKMYDRANEMIFGALNNGGLEEYKVGEQSVFQLSEQVAALYHILHLFRHATCLLLAVRNLCDWVAIFDKYRSSIDVELLRKQLKELQLEGFVANVERICHERLGYTPFIIADNNLSSDAGVSYLDEISELFKNTREYKHAALKMLTYKYMRHKAYKLFFGTTSIFECFIPELLKYATNKVKLSVCPKK